MPGFWNTARCWPRCADSASSWRNRARYGRRVGEPEDLHEDRSPTPEEERLLADLDAALERADSAFIASAYVERLRARLKALAEGHQGRDLRGPLDSWLMIVWDGKDPRTWEPVSGEFWCDLVIAAADATNDESEAWCIADGPACHLVGDHEEMMARLQEARASHPRVDAMFRAYQDDLTSMGYEWGWWGDDNPAPAVDSP